MDKPCNDCGKKVTVVGNVNKSSYFNLNLDIAEGALHAAWVTDVSEEQRAKLTELILQVQSFKKPYKYPVDQKIWALRRAASMIEQDISCKYCKQHFFCDVVLSIDWALAVEHEQYKRALKLLVYKEIAKTRWLIQAFYHKIILTKIDLWKEKIKWCILKYHPDKDVKSVTS